MTPTRPPAGFTLVELLLGMGLTLAILGTVLTFVAPSTMTFQLQPERQDLQQRVRAAVEALQRDLSMAGAGLPVGRARGALHWYLAPVRPYRTGERNPDPPKGVFFRPDTVSVMYVPSGAIGAAVRQVTHLGSSLAVLLEPNCGPVIHDRVCGFTTGTRAMLFDRTGRSAIGSVVAVDGDTVHLTGSGLHDDLRDGEGTMLTPVEVHVYGIGRDAETGAPRLNHYDGAAGDMPAVDHLVGLRVEYFGAPAPPRAIRADAEDPASVHPTWGPAPPPPGHDRPHDAWGAGENCLFAHDGSGYVSRLAVLPGGPGLVALDPSLLTDGPWCPDASHPERFDADLLRIRRLRLFIRVEAASPQLRGPAGPLFTRPGTAPTLSQALPDVEIRLDVAPRNLGLVR